MRASLCLTEVGLSFSCPSLSLVHIKSKHGVLIPTAMNCVSFGKPLHFLICKAEDLDYVLCYPVVCLLLPSFLSSASLFLVVVFFCFPWGSSGSLDCLHLYVIVVKDPASCSMCRGMIHNHSDPQKAPSYCLILHV